MQRYEVENPFSGRDDMRLTAVDSEPTMINQARANLAQWLEQWIVHLYSDESPDHVMRETAP